MIIESFTPEEAATKWCPFVRIPYTNVRDTIAAAVNRDGRGDMFGRCIGTQCMAWRRRDVLTSETDGRCGLVPV